MDSDTVTNNYLMNAIFELSQELEDKDDVSIEAFAGFINELRVSTLLAAGIEEEDKVNFEILAGEDDENVLPLFTDLEEFNAFDHDMEYQPIANDIEFYCEMVREYDLQGVLINPVSDDFLIENELLLELPLSIGVEDETPTNPLDADELLELSKNTTNSGLEELISQDSVDFESLMLELTKSTLFNLVLTPKGKEFEKDIVEIDKINEYSHCTTGDENTQYGVLFTNTSIIRDVIDGDEDYYYQIVQLGDYMEMILKNDMDGIIINPGVNDLIITRRALLEAYQGLSYNNPETINCVDYLFKI